MLNHRASPVTFPQDYFRELAGYWEWLVQQNEERELCYRALQRGWGVGHYPGVTVYHDYTPAGRDWNRHEYYTMRNEMAVELRMAPLMAAGGKLLRNLLLALLWSVENRRSGYLHGYFAGIKMLRFKCVRRLTPEQFGELRTLAWS